MSAPSPTPPPDPSAGLDERPKNATCLAPDRGSAGVTLAVAPAFPNLPAFEFPVAALQAPGDPGRWFVVEQHGRVRRFANDPNVSSATTFIDIADRVASSADGRGGEAGLLGMAFHPGFAANGRVFLSYTTLSGTQLRSRVSEFLSRDGGQTLDRTSERVLLEIVQPQDNHNGGGIAFGPFDGYLYIGIGDGGSANDTGPGHADIGNAQSLDTLLGKMLRIDVDSPPEPGFGYAIPDDNPFPTGPLCGMGGSALGTGDRCAEIYAFGLRNPWRWSFDRETGELWVGDVGQGAWEEIDRVIAGGNYGWRCREGAHDANAGPCGSPDPEDLLDPVAEYGRSLGNSVTGGYVYRGSAIPTLRGRYVFGDFGSGRIWHVANDTTPTLAMTAAGSLASGLNISSFAEGLDGELYVVNYGGTLHRLQASGGTGTDPIPSQLSATGCVDAADPSRPASGLIPYAPAAPFWSDGADKERWIALPDGQRITVLPDGDWEFPNGSVLVKHFRLGQRLVETRLLMRHPDGVWGGYTYAWNDAQTDATRVIGGGVATIDGRTWIYPSESECFMCHTSAAGVTLGLETAQLNRDFTYAQTGRTANQVVTLNAIGTLTPPVTQAPEALPSLPDPYGSAGSLAERARAYLHTNCSQCHRPQGSAPFDLRRDTALAATGACDAPPERGDLGIVDARIIAPGSAARSVLVARMSRRDSAGMPPLGSAAVDTEGVTLVSAWIDSLTGCN